MKVLFPLRPLSNYDRFSNLFQIVSNPSEFRKLSSNNPYLTEAEQPACHLSLRDIANKYMPNLMARFDNIMSKGSK